MNRGTFIHTFVLSSSYLLFCSFKSFFKMKNENIQLQIIYNNMGEAGDSLAAWGFSAFIQSPEGNMLFDTGGDVKVFENNLSYFQISPMEIDYIFISHNHWDHKNGLQALKGKLKKECVIYVPDSEKDNLMSEFPGFKMVGIGKAIQINKYFWSTGELINVENGLWEHSLIINKAANVSLITGCSHPGISDIVSKMRVIFPGKNIELVTGGFHLKGIQDEHNIKKISDELKSLDIDLIAPSHCTGDLAIDVFRSEWKEHFITLFLGDQYTF
jgi:7,8-dihydropterin-6-yl-methyl-4-(beta-D-ribofuranosyl)aminobenzene 5'-phosphate synthase